MIRENCGVKQSKTRLHFCQSSMDTDMCAVEIVRSMHMRILDEQVPFLSVCLSVSLLFSVLIYSYFASNERTNKRNLLLLNIFDFNKYYSNVKCNRNSTSTHRVLTTAFLLTMMMLLLVSLLKSIIE